jgi:RNA polymerase sigma-70 factor (ECF subfamily)
MHAFSDRAQRRQLKLVEARLCYSQLTDVELVEACKRRDESAFTEIVRRHQRTVYSMLYQLAPDWRSDLNDLVQEVFIRVWRSIATLKNPHAFRTWLNHIASNLFYDELRKRPKVLCVSLDQYTDPEGEEVNTLDIADTSALPDEVTERNEFNRTLCKAISKIPRQFRAAVVLRDVEGLSYEDVATLTNSEIGTVKSRIARGRAKIQELLRPALEA